MSTVDTPTQPRAKAPKRRPVRSDCCAEQECTSGRKNVYYPGKRLTPGTFKVEQDYLVQRRRLLNRAMHGWGVVYGFGLAMAGERLEVADGLALDAAGRELVQVNPVSLAFSSVTVLDQAGHALKTAAGCGERREPPSEKACWLLRVHYAERPIAPVKVKDACSCEREQWDQLCETVHYTVQQIDCAKCCAPQDCDLACGCATSPCCGVHRPVAGMPPREKGGKVLDERKTLESAREAFGERIEQQIHGKVDTVHEDRLPRPQPLVPRGGCDCLCQYLTKFRPADDCDRLCEMDGDCGPLRVDLLHGVPLACVALGVDECGRWTFTKVVEACGPRRLVKRNDLLFDLIRGCDLTHIVETGWARWHRSETTMPWHLFTSSWGQDDGKGGYRTAAYWVKFSGPVLSASVRPDCFTLTAVVPEDEGGWGQVLRVPIIDVDDFGKPPQAGDPPGTQRYARVVVDAGWVKDAILGTKTVFNHQRVLFELAFHGDFVVDCKLQTVDASVKGLLPAPSGNGTPGKTYLSNFPVGPRPRPGSETQKA